jgi:hypothetical protein
MEHAASLIAHKAQHTVGKGYGAILIFAYETKGNCENL